MAVALAELRQLLWLDQRAGDVVYVPRGWWHCTLSVEPTVAFTQNMVLPRDARPALRALSSCPGQERAAAALAGVLRQRHSDS